MKRTGEDMKLIKLLLVSKQGGLRESSKRRKTLRSLEPLKLKGNCAALMLQRQSCLMSFFLMSAHHGHMDRK